MKNLLAILVVMFFLIPNVTLSQDKAKIEFEKITHDYGSFKEDAGPQTYTFKFKNAGSVPLIVNNVQPSCGCTTPEWERKPVAPGGEGFIKVSYDPKNRPGSFNKSVSVVTNAENPTVILYIKGNVIPREKTIAELYPFTVGSLRVKNNHISFTNITENQTKTEQLELINDTDKEITVAVKSTPNHIITKLDKTTIKSKDKAVLTISYDASKNKNYGFVMESIYLDLNGVSDYNNRIGISATIEEDFSKLSPEDLKNAPVATFDMMSFEFGDIKQAQKVEHIFQLKNGGKRDLIIRKLSTSCGCTAVTPEKTTIAQNESVPIKVVFDSTGKSGRQSKAITVITNDPKTPTVNLQISCNVVIAQ